MVCCKIDKPAKLSIIFPGGTGGQGGEGGKQGGEGGHGEGPKMSYDVKTEHFIVNNLYVDSSSSKNCFLTLTVAGLQK
jgi:hypothetical protein